MMALTFVSGGTYCLNGANNLIQFWYYPLLVVVLTVWVKVLIFVSGGTYCLNGGTNLWQFWY